ncbi:hypothetical protein C0J52_23259 [Blattella germanica]|nr:hypothetical protein C0J52_23259 [Blattella germanica]
MVQSTLNLLCQSDLPCRDLIPQVVGLEITALFDRDSEESDFIASLSVQDRV